jgi:hypothetical protein
MDSSTNHAPSLGGPIVILTEGISHLACQTLTTDHGFKHQPRAQSGRTNCHPYQGNITLCMSNFDHRPWIQVADTIVSEQAAVSTKTSGTQLATSAAKFREAPCCRPTTRRNTRLEATALVDTNVSEQAAVSTKASGTQLASVEIYNDPRNFSKLDLNRADVLCVVCCVCVCVCVCVCEV